MEQSPLVSILMPVYNSSDFVRSENQPFLTQALDSLLAQTYSHFELIILDNISTDRTLEICQSYVTKDKRVKVIVDSERRFVEGSINQLASLMHGDFCFIANDDDIWDPHYIEKLISVFKRHPELDLVYSNGKYLDISNRRLKKMVADSSFAYTIEMARASLVSNYLHHRNVIPLAFGIFKAESFRNNLPYTCFDNLKANVDHLFVADFLLKGSRLAFLDEDLFFYRSKSRRLDPKKVIDMPDLSRPHAIYWYYVRHQLYFLDQIISRIQEKVESKDESLFILFSALDSFVLHAEGLLHWLIRDFYFRSLSGWLSAIRLRKFIRRFSRKYLLETSFFIPFGENLKNIRTSTIQLSKIVDRLDALFSSFLKFINGGRDFINREEDLSILNEVEALIRKHHAFILKAKSDLSKERFMRQPVLKMKSSSSTATEAPRVSVISASKNLGIFLEETIVSVAAQTYRSVEHLLIDGASTDQTLEIVKRFPHLKCISEPDLSYSDAFWKGFALAQGEYIFQCAVSDGYLDEKWIEKCVEVLDSDSEVSLVWGFPQTLSEDGKILELSYPQFHYRPAPNKKSFFDYWLQTKFWMPEGNFCIRRNVIAACFPKLEEISADTEPWLEFNYRFNRRGYLAQHLPRLANFGRHHKNQLGQREAETGVAQKKLSLYFRKSSRYLIELLLGRSTHQFRNGDGRILQNPVSPLHIWAVVLFGIWQQLYFRVKKLWLYIRTGLEGFRIW